MTKSKHKLLAFLAMLTASALANAVPIVSGSTTLDSDATVETFEIDVTGFNNLTLDISTIGGGSIDRCGRKWYSDCLSVSAADAEVFSRLTITDQWQDFSASISTLDSIFELIFNGQISGGDESIIVDWQISGDTVRSALPAPEPGTLLLLTVGVLGIATARRRKG